MAEKKSKKRSPKANSVAAVAPELSPPPAEVLTTQPVVAQPVVLEPVVLEPVILPAVAVAAPDVELIRVRARALWQARGGSALDNWLEAERSLASPA